MPDGSVLQTRIARSLTSGNHQDRRRAGLDNQHRLHAKAHGDKHGQGRREGHRPDRVAPQALGHLTGRDTHCHAGHQTNGLTPAACQAWRETDDGGDGRKAKVRMASACQPDSSRCSRAAGATRPVCVKPAPGMTRQRAVPRNGAHRLPRGRRGTRRLAPAHLTGQGPRTRNSHHGLI